MTFIPIEPIEHYNARVQHHKDVDIPAWQNGTGDWFTVRLYELMAHADTGNRARLAAVFPAEAEAFEWWLSGGLTDKHKQGDKT